MTAKKKPIRNFIKQHPYWSALIFLVLLIIIVGALLVGGFFYAVYSGKYGDLPTYGELRAIKNPLASEVYSEDGVLLGKFYIQNRTNVAYEDISPNIINALVATEDARFFEHEGVDARSMFRVLFKSIILGDETSGGGSTISQQLIKNLFPRGDHGILSMPVNKTREAIIARRLETQYTKTDILTLYLNTVSFGEQAYGIETATKRFFGVNPDSISVENAAVLIGMLKAPTYYSPRKFPERSKQRRNTVIDQMAKYEYINPAEGAIYKARPISLVYYKDHYSDGLAPHFREQLRKDLKKWCLENKKIDGTKFNIYTDGLKIYTSLNSKLQTYAEEANAVHLKALQADFEKHWKDKKPWDEHPGILQLAMPRSERYIKLKAQKTPQATIERIFNTPAEMTIFTWNGDRDTLLSPMDSIKHYMMHLNNGFMAMEPETGYVRAWVGSISHKHFQYDHTQGQRQVGSTFKPIVYATALQDTVEPCSFFSNSKKRYGDWAPGNADGKYGGYYSLRGGLCKSVNTVSVRVIMDVGYEKVIAMARALGMESAISEDPTIALGTPDISLEEMVSAYSAFANGGYKTPAHYILAIHDKNDQAIATFRAPYKKYRGQAMSELTADAMVKMLEAVADSGTARRLRFRYKFTNQMGGKTGTTQNQSDGWFLGITPKLVAGAWTGGQDRRIRFNSIKYGQGANMALPVFGEFFQRVYADPEFKSFAKDTFQRLPDSLAHDLGCALYKSSVPSSRLHSTRKRIRISRYGKPAGSSDATATAEPTEVQEGSNSVKTNTPAEEVEEAVITVPDSALPPIPDKPSKPKFVYPTKKEPDRVVVQPIQKPKEEDKKKKKKKRGLFRRD